MFDLAIRCMNPCHWTGSATERFCAFFFLLFLLLLIICIVFLCSSKSARNELLINKQRTIWHEEGISSRDSSEFYRHAFDFWCHKWGRDWKLAANLWLAQDGDCVFLHPRNILQLQFCCRYAARKRKLSMLSCFYLVLWGQSSLRLVSAISCLSCAAIKVFVTVKTLYAMV